MPPRNYGPFPYSPIIDRPPLKWPNGKRLAVWIIPNIEYFPMDAEITGELPHRPNVMAWARRDYGNRIGVYRIMETMGNRGIRATVALNSDICIEHPRIIEKAMELDWELMGHGESNTRPLHKIPADKEREVIARTLSTIEKISGKRPQGWLGSGLNETWSTLDHLAAEGARYVADWVNDDQPYYMNVGKPPLVSIPYSAELNDTQMINRKNYTPDAFGDMIRRQFEVLYEESAASARVMAICIHPWITGVPHAIPYLGRALDALAKHDGVWFATGSEIVDAYIAQAKSGQAS